MFKLPETLDGLSIDELKSLREEAVAAAREIDGAGEDLSAEQVAILEAILDAVATVDERVDALETEESERVARLSAARERIAGLDAAVEDETPVDDADEETVETQDVVDVSEQEAVVAAAGQKRPTVAKAARKAPAVIIPKSKEEPVVPLTTIVAAANVPDYSAGAPLADMGEVASAFLQRVGSFGQNDANMKPGLYQMTAAASRHGVARIKRKDREFSVSKEQGVEEQFQTIMEAAREARLSGGSVLAAGGWCAPSEIDYGFCELETTEGLIDVPEVQAKRGGISFTKGPDFATLFADTDFGFIQTETQAEAGTTKPCYAVECPPFQEVRMDAIGFCITAGLLTNASYPELVRRVLNLAGVGHARRKSKSTIDRILAAITKAYTWAPVSAVDATSATADILAGLEFHALLIRQTLAMSPTATIEGFAPYWLRPAIRADLSRRLGLPDPLKVTDADVDGWLALRGIRLQYVYDYQMLTDATTGTGTAFPSTVTIPLYPAGAFVRLANGVINLDAVYDHDLLTQNTYTAAFMEEGIAVANTCGYGVKVTFALNYRGASGFPSVGSGAGITIPSVA